MRDIKLIIYNSEMSIESIISGREDKIDIQIFTSGKNYVVVPQNIDANVGDEITIDGHEQITVTKKEVTQSTELEDRIQQLEEQIQQLLGGVPQ